MPKDKVKCISDTDNEMAKLSQVNLVLALGFGGMKEQDPSACKPGKKMSCRFKLI